jgi:hypothetical protein
MGRFSTGVFEQLFSLHTLVLLAFSKTGHDWLGPFFCGPGPVFWLFPFMEDQSGSGLAKNSVSLGTGPDF